MRPLEQFLSLLFLTIIAGIVLTNARGVADILRGFAQFTGETVQAFSGFRGRGV